MYRICKRTFTLCACIFAIAIASNAQTGKRPQSNSHESATSAVINGTRKVAVVVVGSAAEVAWRTTKFTTKYVVKPTATALLKPLITKAAPHAAGYLLKTSAKYLMPLAIKLSVL